MRALAGALSRMPLVAILRGIEPAQCEAAGEVLVSAGFTVIEVPLNSPEPYASIRRLRTALGDRALVGAGTVLTAQAVDAVAAAGGQLVVMPHSDPAVIRRARERNLECAPGVATPTEAFAALAAGADALKLFPAEALPPAVVKAWRAVLPPQCLLVPVGGITPDKLSAYRAAGASGFGLGSALYSPGSAPATLGERAHAFVNALAGSR